tara:strand:- start:147 stop:272 length:126 start_codon:yes stop_codon:yes gene_type:complete
MFEENINYGKSLVKLNKFYLQEFLATSINNYLLSIDPEKNE